MKLKPLILPSSLLLCGFAVFLCGLVRTFYVGETMPRNDEEKKQIQSNNEYVEWWIGIPLMLSAVLGIVAVSREKPFVLKVAGALLALCFIQSLVSLMLDCAELSQLSGTVQYMNFLKMEGFACKNKHYSYNFRDHVYNFTKCECKLGDQKAISVGSSCELIVALYTLYFIIVIFTSCSCGLSLFTLASFVLILKRIPQITNAGNFDDNITFERRRLNDSSF